MLSNSNASVTHFRQLAKDCEDLLANAQVHPTQAKLIAVDPLSVPREHALALAKLCRRSGLTHMGLKILTPYRQLGFPLSHQENTEYAVLLHQIGCTREALDILTAVDTKQVPDAHVARVRCQIDQWEHEKALPELLAYLKRPTTPYMAMIMRMNLASTWLALGHPREAAPHVAQLIEDANTINHSHILGKAHTLRAQVNIALGALDKARIDLQTSGHLMQEAHPLDMLVVEKWNAVIDAKKSTDLSSLRDTRKKSLVFGDSESIRDCDLKMIECKFDEEIFNRLYFGTPLPAYRKMLERISPQQNPSKAYSIGAGQTPVLDLQKSAPTDALLKIIFSDLYAPVPVGRIFSDLFRDESFDVNFSLHKVHQVVARTKQWLEDRAIPVHLNMQENLISAQITGPLCINFYSDISNVDPLTEYLQKLHGVFNSRSFTVQQCSRVLDIPISKCRHFIRLAQDKGQVKEFLESGSELYYLTRDQ